MIEVESLCPVDLKTKQKIMASMCYERIVVVWAIQSSIIKKIKKSYMEEEEV